MILAKITLRLNSASLKYRATVPHVSRISHLCMHVYLYLCMYVCIYSQNALTFNTLRHVQCKQSPCSEGQTGVKHLPVCLLCCPLATHCCKAPSCKNQQENRTCSSAMAERPRELGDFMKARVNGGTDNHSLKGFSQVSPLPLTDPHHMVIKQFLLLGLAATYICRRWVWSILPPTIRCLRHSPAN